MKKILRFSAIAVSVMVLAAGAVWAGATSPVCPDHGKACIERDGDFYCTSRTEATVNKLVPGRGGQLAWMRVQATELKPVKCTSELHVK